MTNESQQYETIQAKLAELKKEATLDCAINREELFDRINTELLMKWINKRTEWSKLLRTYDQKRKDKFRELYAFYKTEFELKLGTKDEYMLFIESDSNYYTINALCLSVKEIVQYLDSIIEVLRSRQFEINNIIKWRQFQAGQ